MHHRNPPPPIPPFIKSEFRDGFGAKFVVINPRIARELLERNPENRYVSKTRISHYAEDIRAGRWTVNGESIVVAGDGTLIDGQQRLFGCIEAGESFETLLCFGVHRDVRTTIDQGRARTIGDYLTMEGVHNAKMVATVAKRALAFERSGGKTVDGKHLTAAEVMDYVDANAVELAAKEIADLAVYLASDAASGMIGQAINLDGGQVMSRTSC